MLLLNKSFEVVTRLYKSQAPSQQPVCPKAAGVLLFRGSGWEVGFGISEEVHLYSYVINPVYIRLILYNLKI